MSLLEEIQIQEVQENKQDYIPEHSVLEEFIMNPFLQAHVTIC